MIKKANISDAKQIHSLINLYAAKNLMLPRSLNEIYDNIRDFWVCAENNRIIGCCGLHMIGWDNLAEIKSLAVAKNKQKKGIASELIDSCLKEAKQFKVRNIFVLTYVPNFFKRFGFKKISKTRLPHKIWTECCQCPKFPKCDEEALIKSI